MGHDIIHTPSWRVDFVQRNLKKWFDIFKINFYLAARNNLLLAVLYLMLVPFLRGIDNLDAERSAECLKQSVTLIGILLIVPLRVPERSMAIREAVCTRKISEGAILAVRFAMAVILCLILTGTFAEIMVMKKCTFPYVRYVLETISCEIVFGSAGLLMAGLSNSVVIGYLVSAVGAAWFLW